MHVSIIIPVYQVAPYIEGCLRSVMRQTYQGEMECLVVDDCGTDGSMDIAERVIAAYKGPIRFRILRHDRNKGLSAARNTGLRSARGEWVYFLDSDDSITEDCVEQLMAVVEAHPEVDLVQGNVETHPVKNLDRVTVNVRQPVASSNAEVRRCFFGLRQMNLAAWNKLMRRSFLMEHGLWFEEGLIFEDFLWTFYLLKHLERACFVKETTYHYLRRPGSILTGSSGEKRADSYGCIFRQVLTDLTPGHEKEEISYYGKNFAHHYVRYAKYDDGFRMGWKDWREKAAQFGCKGVRWRLALARLLSRTSHGWLLMSLLFRIEHPRSFLIDAQRIVLGSREEC